MKTRSHGYTGGFTLVELLAVITIIVLLAGGLIVSVGYFSRRAGQTRTRSIMRMVEQGIDSFYADFGVYPPEYRDSCNAKFFRGEKVALENPFNKELSDGTNYEPEYLFDINNQFNYSSEILYYYLKTRIDAHLQNDGIYIPRKSPYIELPNYAVNDVDSDGNMEIVDTWGNPILYVAKDLYADAPFKETQDTDKNIEPHSEKNGNSYSLYSYGNDGLGFYEAPQKPVEKDYPVQHKSYNKTRMLAEISNKYGSGPLGIKKANKDNVTNW